MERFEEYLESSKWLDDLEFREESNEFEITTAQQADWAISKIAEERARTEFFINCAKEEKAKLDKQIKDAEKKLENATAFLTGKLGAFLENDDVPKKKATTQISVTLPAGKIIKKLPKKEYVMQGGDDVTKHKSDANFIAEVKDIDESLIKHTEEVMWGDLKKKLATDDKGNVYVKDTGEFLESITVQETLPYIEIKTN
jgi:deoxyribodipyrimidine photolyase